MVLETKPAVSPIFRLGRKPNPWDPPDWSRANHDGTFGNRFDDPKGYYRVLYASSQKISCFLETLARYRPDLTLLAELNEIGGENDFFPPGHVPGDWCEQRMMGTCNMEGSYADIYAAGWVGYLRTKLSGECLRLGLQDLDVAVLQQGQPRQLTQAASREVYEKDLNGVFYRSRYGHGQDNWALFEPFRIVEFQLARIAKDDPDLLGACEILRIKLS